MRRNGADWRGVIGRRSKFHQSRGGFWLSGAGLVALPTRTGDGFTTLEDVTPHRNGRGLRGAGEARMLMRLLAGMRSARVQPEARQRQRYAFDATTVTSQAAGRKAET